MQFNISGDSFHTRCLSVGLFQSGPGHIRFRGDLFDLRKRGFIPMMGDFQSAGIIHQMEITGEVSRASRRLEWVAGLQPHVAFEPSEESQGECCRDPIDRLQGLVDERVDPHFPRALSRELGGPRACSHLLTLFQLIASALLRTLGLEERAGWGPGVRSDGERIAYRSLFVDGSGGEGALQLTSSLSDVHTRPLRDVGEPAERLALHDEVRVVCGVDLPSMSLAAIRAGERSRRLEPGTGGEWRDRTADVAGLKGLRLVSGVARQLIRRFEGRSGDGLLLDALLNIAPGLVQVVVALADGSPSLEPGENPLPRVAATGGRPDSCYMWRAGSPLLQIREGGKSRSSE